MAGDWIKMRGNLWDDPRVARICDDTDQAEAAVIGGLYWLWATADQHSEDGIMSGLTLRAIDRKTGIRGFGEALMAIGWIADHPEGVRIVRFDEHNGASAKKRCQTAKRVANHKADNAKVTLTALPEENNSVSDALPREEKEVNPPLPPAGGSGFAEFWAAYPRKVGKGAAEKAWIKARDRPPLAEVIAALRRAMASDQWQRDGGQFVPHPATWLNQRRWEDGDPASPAIAVDPDERVKTDVGMLPRKTVDFLARMGL